MPLHDSLQGHDVQRLGIRVFGRCLSFCNLHFGRWRFGWFLFGGLLLLFLHRLLNLFHFIFVSHDTDFSLSPETRKNELDRHEHETPSMARCLSAVRHCMLISTLRVLWRLRPHTATGRINPPRYAWRHLLH